MNTIEAIRTRRSIRQYTEKDVSPELIKELLQAAMSAPSAGNEQPWQFVVVNDRNVLDQIPSVSPHAAMCKQAKLAILVCGDTTKEKYPGFWVQDCSAAIMCMLLAAHEKGLGAVWTGAHPVQDRVNGLKKLFDLPKNVIPLGLVVIGHPEKTVPLKDRYQEDRVHHNKW
jgi:nitroreductase